jgi:hypothetical protein
MRLMIFVCAKETYNGSLGIAVRQKIDHLLTVPTFPRSADIVIPECILLGRRWHFRVFGSGVREVELRKDGYKKTPLDDNRNIRHKAYCNLSLPHKFWFLLPDESS